MKEDLDVLIRISPKNLEQLISQRTKELETNLNKAFDRISELYQKLKIAKEALEHINEALAVDCCREAIDDYGLHIHYEAIANEALKEIE